LSPYFTLEEYELADLSLKGSYICIREAAKRMVASNHTKEDEYTGKGGSCGIYSIINISASYESIPKPEADAYTSSMSGVDPFTSSRAEVKGLTKTVAFQLAEVLPVHFIRF
jgi:NAD(P)-dependent dehydrogenase (short-subunit alcohol dehydrogenase family)